MVARYYVQQEADGSWTPVYQDDAGNYHRLGTGSYANQSDAEQAVNAAQGQGTGASSAPAYDQSGSLSSMSVSDQAHFDEQIRQYNASLAEQQRQYNETLAMQRRQYEEAIRQYNANLAEQQRQHNNSMAQSLIQGAINLSGPRDWIKYTKYTTGGQNIFDRLMGNQPAPAFGVSGYSEPQTLAAIMKDLGLA